MTRHLLTVSAPPFWHTGAGVSRTSLITMAALLPAAVAGVAHYRIGALAVIGLSVGSCMLVELVMQMLLKRPMTLGDGSAALTGLLLALLLPAGAPWWLVVVGAASAMIVGKQIFGGLGSNPLNPVLVGWIMIRISWGLHMDADVTLINMANLEGLTPLAALRGGYVEMVNLKDVMLGHVVGFIGSSGLLVLLGGIVLLALRLIKWEVSVGFLVGAFLGFLLLGSKILPEGVEASVSPLLLMFCSPVMLGAFFLAPDPPSSPSQPVAMWIFGVGAGFLAVAIQVFGYYYDAGIPFGILLMSLTCPLLDKIRPKALGKE